MSKLDSADDNGGTDKSGDGRAPAPPAGPPLGPWDGSWASLDPNQQGSGWASHWYFQQNGAVEAPDVLTAAAVVASTEDPHHDSFHRLLYSDYLEQFKRSRDARLAQEAAGTTHNGSNEDSGSQHPDDNAFPDYMPWAQEYLEFVLKVRSCASSRSRSGLAPALCSREQPCELCRVHDGAHVPSGYWHNLPAEEVDVHLREYLRIRDELPPWRSHRAAMPPQPPAGVDNPPAPAQNPGLSAAVPDDHPVFVNASAARRFACARGLDLTRAALAQDVGRLVEDPPVFVNASAARRFACARGLDLTRAALAQDVGPVEEPPVFVNASAARHFACARGLNSANISLAAASVTAHTPAQAASVTITTGAASPARQTVDAGAAAAAQSTSLTASGPDDPGVDGNFISATRTLRDTLVSLTRTALPDGPSIGTPATSAASRIRGWPEGVFVPVVAANPGFMRESMAALTNLVRPASPEGSDGDVPSLLDVSDSSPSEAEDDDDVPPLVDISESSASETEDNNGPMT